MHLDIENEQKNYIQLVIDLRKYFNIFTSRSFLKSDEIRMLDEKDKSLISNFVSIYEKISSSFSKDKENDIFVIRVNFTVVESFTSPSGKFVDSYGNVMVIDWNYIIPTFSEAFLQNIEKISEDKILIEEIQKLIDPVSKINIRNYVLQVDAVLKNKLKYYSDNGAVSICFDKI